MAGWVGSSVRVPGTSVRLYGGKRIAYTPTKDRTRLGFHHEANGRVYRMVRWDQRYASGKRKSWTAVERWNPGTETWTRTDLTALPGVPVFTDEEAAQQEAWAAEAEAKAARKAAKAAERAERRKAWEGSGHVLPYIPRHVIGWTALALAVVVPFITLLVVSAPGIYEPSPGFCGMENTPCEAR